MSDIDIHIEDLFYERELKVLLEAMEEKDMSDRAVVRHFFRMGHMMDTLIREAQGRPIGYLDAQGDFHDPFDTGPKMAPLTWVDSKNAMNKIRESWGNYLVDTLAGPEVEKLKEEIESDAADWENEGGSSS